MSWPQNPILSIWIEGHGAVFGGTAKCYRYATGVPTFDTDGLYKPWLVADRLGQIDWRLDWRARASTVSELQAEILNPEGLTQLFDDAARFLLARTCLLQTALTASTTTVVLGSDGGGLGGEVAWIAREAILLGTEGATGTYTGCVRGVLGTSAQSHDPEVVGADVEVFTYLSEWSGRAVQLSVIDADAADESEEIPLWRGAFVDWDTEGLQALRLTASGGLDLLREIPLGPTPKWQGEVRAQEFFGLWPGEDQPWLIFEGRSDRTTPDALPWTLRGTGGDDPKFLVRFRDSVLEAFYLGGAAAGGLEYAASMRPLYGTPAIDWRTNPPLEGEGVWEVFVSDPLGPYSGAAPPSYDTDVLPLGGARASALVAVLQILCSTESGDNGAYDTGIPFGLGVPVALLDVDGIEALADRVGALGEGFDRFVVGFEEEPEEALRRVEEGLLAPLGCLFSDGPHGLTVVRLASTPPLGETPASVTDAVLTNAGGLPTTFGGARGLDALELSFGRVPGGEVSVIGTNSMGAVQRRLGTQRQSRLDAGAVSSAAKAQSLAYEAWRWWQGRTPEVRFDAPLWESDLYPGQVVEITHVSVPGVSGSTGAPVEGITETPAIITGKQMDPLAGTAAYTALLVGVRLLRRGRVSGSVKVSAWSSGVLTAVTNHFSPSQGGLFARDTDALEEGLYVDLVGDDGVVKVAGLKIDTIVGDAITFTTTPSPAPSSGDLLVPSDYSTNSLATLQEDRSWYASTSGLLASDRGFQYE